MTKKVSDQLLYASTEHLKSVENNFKSTVYSSLNAYLSDQLALTSNEDFKPGLKGEQVRRSLMERGRVLERKISAARRLEQHEEEGGTIFEFTLDTSEIKKACH
ncbi:hypothetical protein [Vibrio europaeus]|uniref:hypothetical protein n=1 Tax=Vibrio europaeus TaxID=300876 RepID=UPI00233E8C81|nr:hypothetical protein [Vibrio europaeus]MDC5711136.1 hypothetical protein [Vibrio europaeus]MDC5713165.1 hypothetical protein [Vibrio europaeus]